MHRGASFSGFNLHVHKVLLCFILLETRQVLLLLLCVPHAVRVTTGRFWTPADVFFLSGPPAAELARLPAQARASLCLVQRFAKAEFIW